MDELREFLGGVPGRAFSGVAWNTDCRPANLVDQPMQFMFRKMRRKFVDKNNKIDTELLCLKMFVIHHAAFTRDGFWIATLVYAEIRWG